MGRRAEQFVLPITSVDLVSAGTVSATYTVSGDEICRGVRVGTAGTLNLTIDGEEHDDFPIFQGDNPIVIEAIRAGGSASNIWALY